MGRKKHNSTLQNSAKVEINNSATKKIVLDIEYRQDRYDACNTLVLSSGKRTTSQVEIQSSGLNNRRHLWPTSLPTEEIEKKEIVDEKLLAGSAGVFAENKKQEENVKNNKIDKEAKNKQVNKNENTMNEELETVAVNTKVCSNDKQSVPESVTPSKQATMPSTEQNEMSEIRAKSLKMLQKLFQPSSSRGKDTCKNKDQISIESSRVAIEKKEIELYNSLKRYPKPNCSFPCLVALAIKDSPSGIVTTSEVYNFVREHFPYFKTTSNYWKDSIKQSLISNPCFLRRLSMKPRYECYQWSINPGKISEIEEQLKESLVAIRNAMAHPDKLEVLQKSKIKLPLFDNCVTERTTYNIDVGPLRRRRFISEKKCDSSAKEEKIVYNMIHREYIYAPEPPLRRKAPLLMFNSIATNAFRR